MVFVSTMLCSYARCAISDRDWTEKVQKTRRWTDMDVGGWNDGRGDGGAASGQTAGVDAEDGCVGREGGQRKGRRGGSDGAAAGVVFRFLA